MSEVCPVCKKTAKQKCSACNNVFYCSREHQKLDWKQHSKTCSVIALCENEILGRHYIATRKIEAGSLILEEIKPLLTAPQEDTCPLCLACYSELDATTAKSCQACGWPLCDKCQKHGDECQFTQKYRPSKVIIKDFGISHPMYRCIGVIRALALRETNPNAYQQLVKLESHLSDGSEESAARFREFSETAKFVKKFFQLDDVDDGEITKILGILQINGHEVPTTENPHVAVYELASYFEHNCRANASKSFTEHGGIIIRAAETIAKGDHITVCYTDPLWGVTNRRHHLAQTKFFNCFCRRCSDPTEFGTMFNALKCTKSDCGGPMLPVSFTTTTEKLPDYVCNQCSQSMPWNAAEIMLENIGVELSQMKKNDVEACRNFLQHHSKHLHANHFYMTDVKLALAQIIGQQDARLQGVSDELVNVKLTLCKKLDELLRVLVPAENRIRGLILFESHAAIAEYGRRQPKDQLRGMLMLSRKTLAEAYQLLQQEPEILPEGKIARVAYKNLQQMDLIIKTLCQTEMAPM